MRIRVLGTTGVDGSAPLTGRDAKVLAALVVGFPDPVTSASLAQAVWGSAPPVSWEKILQGSVSRLRRSCGAGAITTEAGGYRLTVDAADIGRAMAAETGNRMLAAMVDVLASMGREGPPTDSLTAALDAAAALRDRGARIQAGMALLRAADLFAALGEQQTAAVLVRAVRRTGLDDWRSLHPLLHLDHLGRDIDASEFAPMPVDLEAAIRLGRDACEQRVRR